MKKRLSVKELLHVSWNQFIENLIHWLFLYGAQFVTIISFLLCSSIILALVHYFFVDLCLFRCALHDYSRFFTVSMVSIVSIASSFFFLSFSIMYRQNALDCVQRKQMSGFDINNRFFSYGVAMFVAWVACAAASLLFLLPGLLLAQRLKFVGLYLLDHGCPLRTAFRASWMMTRGYTWFLLGICLMQWLLFLFCGTTIILVIAALAVNRLIDANMYKQLHMEFDKDLALCSCEA